MMLHVTPREGFISLDIISSGLLVPHVPLSVRPDTCVERDYYNSNNFVS